MRLYHGTDNISARSIVEDGILFDLCDEFTDNGRGFYLSEKRAFAANRAQVMTLSPRSPKVIEFLFDDTRAEKELNILRFDDACDEWKFFVAINRAGMQFYPILHTFFPWAKHNLDHAYDIVIDIPADARISDKSLLIEHQLKSALVQKDYMRFKETVLNLIRSIEIGTGTATAKQYSFHTHKALAFLQTPQITD